MRLQVAEDLLELIGATPMLRLRRLVAAGDADLYAKLEFMNPGGSVKDRAALGMILDAERKGLIGPGSTIIEPTAGNMGIGLALVCLARGYRCVVCMPERFSREKRILIKALGAELHITPDEEGMQGAIRRARELAAGIPGSYIPQQFENPANPDYHYATTAAEIWEQMGGRLDAVVIGAGTGGTISGVARFMKERDPAILTVAVEAQGSVLGGGPAGTHKVEGIGASFVPANFHRQYIDEIIMIYDDEAFAVTKKLARLEGMLVGSSSGANTAAALRIARRLGRGKRVVTLLPDGAERYLSTGIYD